MVIVYMPGTGNTIVLWLTIVDQSVVGFAELYGKVPFLPWLDLGSLPGSGLIKVWRWCKLTNILTPLSLKALSASTA